MSCVITSATANAVRFEDKMQILAHLNRTKAVIGFHGEVVSPYVLTQIVNSRTAATDSGMVFISGDTMQIAYYSLKSKKLDKIETYYAKDYITGTGELVMDGKQSYFLDGKLLCEEIIQNNTLKKTVWYLADGTSDRSYIFRNNRLTQQIQHYPSGKIKWMEIYLPNGSVQQRIFSEDGQPAEISEPSISEGFETFERYFNRHFLMDRFFKNGEYTVCLHVNAEGQSELIIWDNDKIKYPHHFASNQPVWSPATIHGKTTAFTIVRKLRYQPFMFIQNGDTVHVAPSVGESASIHDFKWRDCQLWMPSSVDTSAAYATCERTANTITMSCYDASHQLKTQQVFGYAPDDSISTVQGSRGFNFKTFKESLRELTQDWNLVLFTKYQDGQRVYREHRSNGFCDTITWYYPDQSIRYAIYMEPESNIHTYKELLEYYPTGELKMREISEKTAGKYNKIYFNKEGKAVKKEKYYL